MRETDLTKGKFSCYIDLRYKEFHTRDLGVVAVVYSWTIFPFEGRMNNLIFEIPT